MNNNQRHAYYEDRIIHVLNDIDSIKCNLNFLGYSSEDLFVHLERARVEINAAYHSMRKLETEDREDFLNGNRK